jgi:twitching motility protein PilT
MPDVATALRSAGHEDVDVVLVGELGTAEAVEQALWLASSGVLVLAGVYALDAPATLEQLAHLFPEEEQRHIRGLLADSLAGILSQQLVRSLDGKSRVLALEVLLGGHLTAAMIRAGNLPQLISQQQAGAAQGVQTLDQHLEQLVTGGKVTPTDALEQARDRVSLAQALKRLKPELDLHDHVN